MSFSYGFYLNIDLLLTIQIINGNFDYQDAKEISSKLEIDIKEITEMNYIEDEEITQQKEEERKLEQENEDLECKLEAMQAELDRFNKIDCEQQKAN